MASLFYHSSPFQKREKSDQFVPPTARRHRRRVSKRTLRSITYGTSKDAE